MTVSLGSPQTVPDGLPPAWLRWSLLVALLYFPVCGLKELPLGGGGRYLSVLAGPLSLLFLLTYDRLRWRDALRDALQFASPFAPFLLACGMVLLAHPDATIGDPFSRVFWAAIIAAAATRVRPPRATVYSAAAIGAVAYLAVAVRDIRVLGAVRAGAEVNEIIFAQTAMLAAGLAIVGSYAERTSHWFWRLGWFFAGAGSLIAVGLSGSRGPLLAVFVLIALLAWDGWKRGHRQTVVLGLFTSLAVVAAALVWTPLGPRVQLGWTEAREYFLASNPTVTSVGIRLELWRIALVKIAEQPLLGFGYSTVHDLATQVGELRFMPPEILDQFHHFHSDWAHALMAGGFVLLAGLTISVIALLRQARGDLARGWLVLAMITFGLTDLAFFRKPGFTLFIAAWALLSTQQPSHSDAKQASPIPG